MKKLLLVVVLVAIGCSSDPASISIKDYPSKLLDAECKQAVACQSYPDVATCKASILTNNYFLLTMQAAVTAKEVKFDGGAAASCLNEIAAQGCAFTGFQPTPNDPCNKIFTGLVAAGGACSQSAECASSGTCMYTDQMCDPNAACCTGTCMAAATKMPIGSTCTSSSDCVDGSYCAQTSMKCAALVTTEGAACDGFEACANPMLCNLDFSTGAFKNCYTPAARMATCDTTNFFPCADFRDYCDATAKKCTPDVAIGATCGGTNGAQCVAYADCTGTTTMTCTAKATTGMACTVDQNGFSNCLGDLQCTSSSCTLPTDMACP